MRHDAAQCEMILTCQLVVGNWADLHANGLRLLNNVGESGTITRGDVHRFHFVLDFPELKKHFGFVCALYTGDRNKNVFSVNNLLWVKYVPAHRDHLTVGRDSCFHLLTVRSSGAHDLRYLC